MTLDSSDLRHVLDHTASLWPALRGKRVFLTGGTGFFGRWLVETYLTAHAAFDLRGSLVVLTRSREAFAQSAQHLVRNSALEVVEGTQSDFVWPEGRFDAVIHAAIEYGTPLAMLESNQLGTRRVLALAAERGVERLLFTSSGAVYGPQAPDNPFVVEEHASAPDPMLPQSVYGELKRLTELSSVVHAQAAGFECKIARCFAFVGPHLALDRSAAIGNFMGDVMQGRAIRILGDGTPIRSYLYAADLAIWLWKILIDGVHARPYNVGSDEPYSIAEIAEHVAAQGTPKASVDIAEKARAGQLPLRYVPSIRRAREELGLAPLIGLDDAIHRTLSWHRRNSGSHA